MTNYLFIDLSYYIFYSYYARKKYFEIKKIDLDFNNLINNDDFMQPFKCFNKKIKELFKKLKLSTDTKIIFAKDCKRSDIWRNKIYPQYKASRKTDNQIKDIFIYVMNNTIDKYNCIENSECEADDIIGILTKSLYKDSNITIITGDYDYLQLLYNDNIQIFNMKCNNLRTKSSGNRRTDLMLKILCGDKSDNIYPIHSKLGEKTALKYIEDEEELKKKFCDSEIENKYNLNTTLIDMDYIPIKYREQILEKFDTLLKNIEK